MSLSASSDSTTEVPPTINILTFGDSLTEGYHRFGFAFHPYSNELKRCIDENYGDRGKNVCVKECGLSGEFTDHMIPRLRSLLDHSSGESVYNVVCILAGTNDLSSDDSAEEIFNRLSELYSLVFAHHENTVLVTITIPEALFLDFDYVERRSSINSFIKDHASSMNERKVICLDLEKEIPYRVNKEKDSELWDDALHMTPAGYDKFGGLIFRSLESTLEEIFS